MSGVKVNISGDKIQEIGEIILRCEDVVDEDWDSLSFVFDIVDGAVANSGFLYSGDEIIPAIAEVEDDPVLLDNKIVELRNDIAEQCGHNFCQILIQMEGSSGNIKIDFEFDNPDRWKIVPGKLKEIREALRPEFS